MAEKYKVAFICVHNSCRSQIAEALAKHLAADIFEAYSDAKPDHSGYHNNKTERGGHQVEQ